MAEKHSEKIIEGRQLSYRYTLYDDAGNPAEERTALEDVDLDVAYISYFRHHLNPIHTYLLSLQTVVYMSYSYL